MGIACWVELAEAQKPLLCMGTPLPSGAGKGFPGKGVQVGGVNLGEPEEGCRPEHLALFVALPPFWNKVANWWPEAQCCPQTCSDWAVLCLKETNQHLQFWRFHRKIHPDFLLISLNKWADQGL